jgi:hypothetical protein
MFISLISSSPIIRLNRTPNAKCQYDTMAVIDKTATHSSVSVYYGTTLQKTTDLLTNACCTSSAPPPHIASAIANIHTDVLGQVLRMWFLYPRRSNRYDDT